MMMGTITNKATELLATDASLLGDAVLDGLTVIEGAAGLWDGARRLSAAARFRTVADILAVEPWHGMDAHVWQVDEHGDLRYTGFHRDGVNTCVFRAADGAKLGPLVLSTLGL